MILTEDEINVLNNIIVSKRDINALDLMYQLNNPWKKVFNNGEGVGEIINKEEMCEGIL